MLKSLAMTETLDTYTAGTSPEDFAQSDLPDDLDGDDEVVEGVIVDEPLKWGTTVDPKTGLERPKKAPGRPRKQPTADELASAPEIPREPDKPPQRPPGHKPTPVTPVDESGPSMPRKGIIAAGVNKLYRRGGKILRGLEGGDPMGFGQALIECARIDPDEPEDERELTVGEAWENLARGNPRVRAFILKVIMGGDITDLVMAHAPIGIAFASKPWIQRFIGPMIESMGEPDEDEEEGTALPGGLTAEDVQVMQDLNDEQMKAMARKAAAGMGHHISDADLERAMKQAQAKLPAGLTRNQPKSKTRAQRTGAR